MNKLIAKSTLALTLLAVLLLSVAVPVEAGNVNKGVRIEDGEVSGGESSVNGSISVGRGAEVNGELSTVNGRIRVEADARVEDVSTVNGSLHIDSGVTADDLSTVNGAIALAENVTVNGQLEAANGEIEIERGSKVARDVSNVSGRILLRAGKVGGDLSTVSGDIELAGGSEVMGDLVVNKSQGWGSSEKKSRVPEIIIGPGSRVHGTIRLDRVVKLYISDTAEVGGVSGEMSMSEAIRFSGERP